MIEFALKSKPKNFDSHERSYRLIRDVPSKLDPTQSTVFYCLYFYVLELYKVNR